MSSYYEILSRPVRDVPERQRPRELFDRLGAENVSEEVLLALILRSGVQGISVIELARGLLERYGSLTGLARASTEELAREPGMGPVKGQVLKASLELARRLTQEALAEECLIRTPEDAARVLREEARSLDVEIFWVLVLDKRNRLKRPPCQISKGVLDASLVHPREIFREAIRNAAAAVVLLHNHPSGDPTPSAEDIKITRQLVEAGKVVDIDVMDHLILGQMRDGQDSDFFSLRESGIVKFP